MTRFPTAGHLVSCARYAFCVKETAGKKKGKNSTGYGNPYLAAILGNGAAAAAKTDSFPATATVGLPAAAAPERQTSPPAAPSWSSSGTYSLTPTSNADLGRDYYTRRTDPDRRRPEHVCQIEALGYVVILNRAA